MTLKQSIAIGLMAALPFAALAQRPPDAVDDKAAVPSLTYKSAFAGYVSATGTDDETTPDKRWHAANAKVAQSENHAGHDASAPTSPPTPAKETPVDHSNH